MAWLHLLTKSLRELLPLAWAVPIICATYLPLANLARMATNLVHGRAPGAARATSSGPPCHTRSAWAPALLRLLPACTAAAPAAGACGTPALLSRLAPRRPVGAVLVRAVPDAFHILLDAFRMRRSASPPTPPPPSPSTAAAVFLHRGRAAPLARGVIHCRWTLTLPLAAPSGAACLTSVLRPGLVRFRATAQAGSHRCLRPLCRAPLAAEVGAPNAPNAPNAQPRIVPALFAVRARHR
ncbi:uncharacterized protein V1518DRAFT_403263 [Limtongia smithiae]|uniref:uncharacterized protein n=1 Tax=Limtongia smithiae TaxID=1125753 RepID=UPI0034CFEFCA